MSPSMKIAVCEPRARYYVDGGQVMMLEHAWWLGKLADEITIISVWAPLPRRFLTRFRPAGLAGTPRVSSYREE